MSFNYSDPALLQALQQAALQQPPPAPSLVSPNGQLFSPLDSTHVFSTAHDLHNPSNGEELKMDVSRSHEVSGFGRNMAGPRNKLEMLLEQSDIFGYLARLNAGKVSIHSAFEKSKKNPFRYDSSRKARLNNRVEDDWNEGGLQFMRIPTQPKLLEGGTLRNYQLQGLNWLFRLYQAGLNGILADEMGLGKTIESIATLAQVEEITEKYLQAPRNDHHIIIAPKITINKWLRELNKWFPRARVLMFYGNIQDREDIKMTKIDRGNYDILLTTYEMILRQKKILSKIQYDFMIVDEAQRIKNDKSVLAKTLRKFESKHRLLLTGTPLQNNLHQLWSLLNFLMPRLFDSADEFDNFFNVELPPEDQKDKKVTDQERVEQEKQEREVVQKIHRLLRPFVLRRLKSDVETQIPPKKEMYIFVGMSELQRKLYKQVLSRNIECVNGYSDRSQLLNILMQLKKVCNHPYLIRGVQAGPPFYDGDHLCENAMKFKILDKLLPKLLDQGCKILIFSQMTKLLDVLDDFLRYKGYKYVRVDGKTPSLLREERIEMFQNPDGEKKIFLLSTRAGGLGIDLHQANVVIVYDSDWNPQVDLQAIDRAHRIGQKREVRVYRFVTEGSIEEMIVKRAARKLQVDNLIIQRGKFHAANAVNETKVTQKEIVKILQCGARHILADSDGVIQDEDIEKILRYGQEKTELINKELEEVEEKLQLNKFSIIDPNCRAGKDDENIYAFDGKDYKPKRGKSGEEEIVPVQEEKKEEEASPHDSKEHSVEEIQIDDFLEDQKIEHIELGPRLRPTGEGREEPEKKVSNKQEKQAEREKKRKSKGWKVRAGGGYAHQLYNNERLDQLDKIDKKWKEWAQAAPQDRRGPEPIEFTTEMEEEREILLSEGFHKWTKKDFDNFVTACEQYGRDAIQDIIDFMHTKRPEEVIAYSKRFWERIWDIDPHGKVVERIQNGEEELQKLRNMIASLMRKVEMAIEQDPANPGASLKIVYSKGDKMDKKIKVLRTFDREMDKLILMSLYQFGYGHWNLILHNIVNVARFSTAWMARSLTPGEVQRRVDYLAELIEREEKAQAKKEEKIVSSVSENDFSPKSVIRLKEKLETKDAASAQKAAKESEILSVQIAREGNDEQI